MRQDSFVYTTTISCTPRNMFQRRNILNVLVAVSTGQWWLQIYSRSDITMKARCHIRTLYFSPNDDEKSIRETTWRRRVSNVLTGLYQSKLIYTARTIIDTRRREGKLDYEIIKWNNISNLRELVFLSPSPKLTHRTVASTVRSWMYSLFHLILLDII